MQNLLSDLKELLKQDDRLMVEDNLLKNKAIELTLKLDENLIRLLLSHSRLRQHFFADIDGVLVFDKEQFIQFVSNKAFLPDSYTAFSNKIGLTDDGGRTYLSRHRDVVLAWPYKDCVLEGGQTKEDAKRDEVFWNITLAPDDIDRLLNPKVVTNFWRIDADGEHTVTEITDTDNLIIKGNNLLALHSLLPRFRGRVKLIYIDPPYNTGSDSFGYNDSFTHSTWLTFMRNRLEVAKELLSRDGLLFVQISYHRHAYLQVLLDEIYPGGYICTFNILVRHPDRILKGDKDFHDVIEYLMVYAKERENKIGKLEVESSLDQYVYEIEELVEGDIINVGEKKIVYFRPGEYRILKKSPDKSRLKKISIRGSLKEGNSSGRFYEKHLGPRKNDFPPHTLFGVPNIGNDGREHRYFYTPKEGNVNGGYFQGVPLDYTGTKQKPYANFLDFVQEYNSVGYEGNVELRNAKKPEALIEKVFEIAQVGQNDIVLDFFLGSGTTAAVAHKLDRQYIGVEQLDYGENDGAVRLKNVIDGEQGGISENVGWQGGGSIVVCELMKWNARYIDQILAAQSADELQALWEKMQGQAFLSYKVNFDQFDEHAEEFAQLSLADQKRFLLEVLDKNQLYVNLSEIDDADYQVSDEDKRLNQQFYSTEQN